LLRFILQLYLKAFLAAVNTEVSNYDAPNVLVKLSWLGSVKRLRRAYAASFNEKCVFSDLVVCVKSQRVRLEDITGALYARLQNCEKQLLA
jgi:hypothetical protein